MALDIAPDPSKLLELHGPLELPQVRAPEIGQSVAPEQLSWVSSGNSGHRKGQGDLRLLGITCGRQRVERWAVEGRAGYPESGLTPSLQEVPGLTREPSLSPHGLWVP